MILYQSAIWMQQREEVLEAIRESDGDIGFFLHRKQRLDDYMREQTSRWMRPSGNEERYAPALLLEAGGERSPIVLDEP